MQLAKLQIGFDPGASLTKVVYAVNNAQPKILVMEPEVLNLPAKSVDHLDVKTSLPENQAWVMLDRSSDRIQVCGFLARQFSAVEQIKLLKYEHALYKFLAAVGVIVVQEALERITVDAALVLPYGEINSRDWLKQKIAKSLKRYYFQNTLIRGQLASFNCACEGGGLILQIIQSHGAEWVARNRVTILIFGYRNISCITFHRGVVETQYSSTSDLGFVKLIDQVVARTPGQNRMALTESIYKIGSTVQTNHPDLRLLIRSTQRENIEAEAQMLVNAIKTARSEYWQLVQDWLNSVIPDNLNGLAISGGTGVYLKGELEHLLAWANPIWINSKSCELNRANESLQFRFADVMSLFESAFQPQKVA